VPEAGPSILGAPPVAADDIAARAEPDLGSRI
jgi:hypothetical protein